jgi:PAS domain S-box-containing protein
MTAGAGAAGQKRAEQERIESEARFRLLMESTGEAVIAVDTRTGRIADCNEKAADLLGRPVRELIGLHQSEIHPPEHKDHCTEQLRKIAASKDVTRFECLVRRGDGTDMWVGIRARTYKAGGRKHALAVLRDITDRKRAEEALRRSESLLSSIIEQSPVSTWICDVQGTAIRQNAASRQLFGIDRDEQTVGKYNLFKDRLIREQGHLDKVRQVFEQGKTVRFTLDYDLSKVECVKVPNATRKLLETTIFPIRDSDGRVADAVVQHEDVTELRNAEERLRQAQKMEAIGKLAGGIAHDFNNQLTVVKGYCDILLQNMSADDPLREPIEQILKAAVRSISMTSHLLAYSREQVLRPEVINLNHVLTDMVGAIRQLLGENIELSMNLAEDLGNVRADPAQVQQAITNITINARDAMPQGGRLAIQTGNRSLDADHLKDHPDASAGPHVMMAFGDTGVGMDEATLQRIFDPFFTTKPLGQGTGLGLSMVYGFVKQSGGHFDVTSQPGRGSTFRVFLPQVPAGRRNQA